MPFSQKKQVVSRDNESSGVFPPTTYQEETTLNTVAPQQQQDHSDTVAVPQQVRGCCQ